MKKYIPYIIGFLVLVTIGLLIWGFAVLPYQKKKEEEKGSGSGGFDDGGATPSGGTWNAPSVDIDKIKNLVGSFWHELEYKTGLWASSDRCVEVNKVLKLNDVDLKTFSDYYTNMYGFTPFESMKKAWFICIGSGEDDNLMNRLKSL